MGDISIGCKEMLMGELLVDKIPEHEKKVKEIDNEIEVIGNQILENDGLVTKKKQKRVHVKD